MSADASPDAFGRFRVVGPLGRGGMGSVYLAQDSLLKRRVAVKVPLLDKQADPQVLRRFLREAQAAANVRHPNVCPVFEVGEQGDGYYLVMPYLEGTPLNRRVGPAHVWGPEQALDLMAKLAAGVQAIHEAGLIHRDLKPGNVLIQADGEPVILDLGLARPADEEGERLTRTGQPLGTPAYMAPEQLMGELKRLGPATDVYALGVMLYELLTGELPFVGPLHAVYAQILQGTPRPPSALRPGLGRWADELCQKAMAKDPALRHAGAAELGQAVRSCREALAPRPVQVALDTVQKTVPPPAPPPPAPAEATMPGGSALTVAIPRKPERAKAVAGRSPPRLGFALLLAGLATLSTALGFLFLFLWFHWRADPQGPAQPPALPSPEELFPFTQRPTPAPPEAPGPEDPPPAPPAVEVARTEPAEPRADQPFTITLRATGPEPEGLAFQYRLPPAEEWQPAPDGLVRLEGLAPGKLTAEFRSVDAGGRASAVLSRTWAVPEKPAPPVPMPEGG